jgi:flavodoxin
MNVLVLYQSRSGHTRDAAENIAQVARSLKHEVRIKSVIEVQEADVQRADTLLLGTWVQGFILFGVKPAGAELWVRALPSLAGKPVGVFCTYAFNPRGSLDTLAALLTARGARIVGHHAFQRNRLQEGAEAFVKSALQAAG